VDLVYSPSQVALVVPVEQAVERLVVVSQGTTVQQGQMGKTGHSSAS
jgi:hypothetical protein